jgi:hypothetical protein
MTRAFNSACAMLLICMTVGCASKPPPPPRGFLSTYANLKKESDGAMRYRSLELRKYTAFMVDPVEFRASQDPPKVTREEKAQFARYFNEACPRALRERGYKVVDEAGVGVARLCIAITDIQNTTWWLHIHPATRYAAMGTGAASMEVEVIDSVTGKQVAAAVEAGEGNLFQLIKLGGMGNVKLLIDLRAKAAGEQLDELRQAGINPVQQP